jgi:hypothetical protein
LPHSGAGPPLELELADAPSVVSSRVAELDIVESSVVLVLVVESLVEPGPNRHAPPQHPVSSHASDGPQSSSLAHG